MKPTSDLHRYLASHPHKAALFLHAGRVPSERTVDSPLIRLLESIPVQRRMHDWTGITLSPALGYQCRASFRNAEQLLRWLKPPRTLYDNESIPSMSHQIAAFQRALTPVDLAAHCTRHPLPAVSPDSGEDEGALPEMSP